MKHGRTLSDSTSGQGPRVRWAVDGVRISGTHPQTRCVQKESARNDQMLTYEIIGGTYQVEKRATMHRDSAHPTQVPSQQ